MRFNTDPNLSSLLRRSAGFVTILMLLGSILACSLDSWHGYSDLGKASTGFNVAKVSGDTGPIGDIEPAIFPETPPVSALPPKGQKYAANDVRPISAIFIPHDRPPSLS